MLLFCATGDNLAHCYLQTFEPYAVFFDLAGDQDLSEISRQMSRHPSRMDDRSGSPSAVSPRARPYFSYSSSHSSSGATSSGDSSSASTAELSGSELDALALHLLDILQSPFGGEGRVERCPHLDIGPSKTTTEDSHARFWNSRGFKAPAWDRDEPRSLALASLTRLPLKRTLYGEGCNMDVAVAARKRKVYGIEDFFRRTT